MTAPNKDEDLVEAVLSLCDEIPAGHVVSYGDIAAIAGCVPRQVGKIMSSHGKFTCWWRVVRADGSSAVAEQAVAYWDGGGHYPSSFAGGHETMPVRVPCRAAVRGSLRRYEH